MLLEVLTQRDFIRLKLTFIQKNEKIVFGPPVGDFGAAYALHLQLVGKPMVDFLFVTIEHFSLSLTVETL